MSEQKTLEKQDFNLNLPKTDFPIRPNHKDDDVAMLARWEKENLSEKSFNLNKNKEKFILHDGPPYANGHLHIGHAYNKILKDIVTKSQRMFGKHVPVVPGWDCHGLPIEFAVAKENPDLKGPNLKKACREYAKKWIDVQREEFKQLGVLMDWDHPYLTMDFPYEADTLRAFGILVDKGYIERKNKTVPWCPSCQTVLASAEIEYNDRKDPSIYVLFTLENSVTERLFPQLTDKPISLLVWTTTPWTLPLNRAVLLKPQAQYVVLDTDKNYIIVGQALADKICSVLKIEKKVVAECSSNNIVTPGAWVHHPLIKNFEVPVLLDESVLLDDGTACVHSAPGAGPIDYEVGVKNNLEIYSPVTQDGHYTDKIIPVELAGMSITDAQGWVIKKLLENNTLLHKASITHSYPHCWRCRGGLIFRATKQWFCDLSRNNLKQKALDAIKTINMLPESSQKRFEATTEGRLEWCLSRQRAWGVPIPAFICTSCDYTYITKELIEKVATHVSKSGIEFWDTVTLETIALQNMSCQNCAGTTFEKETDILDVWFDSGISHLAVLKQDAELLFPADMYLEGKDQHRGWFQSSLLTSIVIENSPCMKIILTHGFTVDEQGRKMSKSLGNVVSPQEMIERLGTDGLRLWAAGVDNSGDAVVSEKVLKNVQEVFRKIRNTSRFLLSNLYDFSIATDAIPVEKLSTIDQYALQELYDVYSKILHDYTIYNFTGVFHKLSDYCAVNLSSFYMDISKDRLYVEKDTGIARRSAQTTYYYILDTLTKLMAPILSFTAEQLSDHYQKNKTHSIHLQQFPTIKPIFSNDHAQLWSTLKEIRSALLKAIEIEREKQIIKHSLEAQITMYIAPDMLFAQSVYTFFKELEQRGQTPESFLKEFMIVSQFTIATTATNLNQTELNGLYARVEQAEGKKCPRCWQWDTTERADHLCRRCSKIIS